MRYDFSTVEDTESFVSVPEGSYLCRVVETRPGTARDGSDRWGLRLEVAEGPFAGRTAAWDWITWSARGIHRVKKVLEAFGFDVRGELELEPIELVGKRARVVLETEQWEDQATGRRLLRLRVPYMGYSRPDDGADSPESAPGQATSLEDTPF